MGLVGFECSPRGEKKLLLEQKKLDSALKSKHTLSPASSLNLKMWILKMGVLQAKNIEFFKSCIPKWENRQRIKWPPHKKYTPWIKNILTSPKNPKFQLPPELGRGAHWYWWQFLLGALNMSWQQLQSIHHH